jgi:RNA recognition motif-containing protein
MKQLIISILLITSLGLSSVALASQRIYVGNLPYSISNEEVRNLVGSYGPVESITVKSIDRDGDRRSNAIILYDQAADTDSIVRMLDGFILDGVPLKARKAREIVVVGSKVKEVVREAGLRSDGDLVQAVSERVYEMLKVAIDRAKSNKRGTVRPWDL